MTSSPIDPVVFAELQGTVGAEFAAELVDTFLEEAPAMLAELRAALVVADSGLYRRSAHSLKSNSYTFGAMALGVAARDIELGGFDADPGVDARALDALEAAYEAAAAALKELCDG